MAIYRGIGGAGDSNTDATITAVTEQATDAAQSATEAAASASSAASSAASASSSATTASTAATNASGSAATASTAAASAAATVDTVQTAAANAETSETNAAASESAAATSETNAAASETASAASASSASTSASAASTSASAASTSASAAATSATNAAASESAVATSATNAASSASAASTSATAAASSASAAATSASNAATSESNASDSETAAATSETNASGSATAAASSATAAASSASSASTSATTATTKASEAATSATNAATSASNAAASESAAASSASSASASADAALAALDSFDDRYLGQKASDPTLDNDGNALIAGALYFNTTDDVMKVYEGSTWVAAYASLSGALLSANNLSDVLNAATARTNLGLGTAATTASTDYATAAQGVLADSAIQATDLGTAAYTASTDYATAAQGALADSALQSIPDNYVLNTGDAITGNLTFGDNNKAIFGAGSDLQIYHDGTNSYILDNGTGNLALSTNGASITLGKNPWEPMVWANIDGSVELFHDNVLKLATTSTGIDVTGTVVSDGINSSGLSGAFPVRFDSNNGGYYPIDSFGGALGYNSTSGGAEVDLWNTWTGASATQGGFLFNKLTGASTSNKLMHIRGDGDISFYEDTGTTAKFFWDASAESLGIGTTTPSYPLHIVSTSSISKYGVSNSSGTSEWQQNGNDLYITNYNASGSEIFRTNGTERMRIDSSGNLLVGTTSGSEKLTVSGNISVSGTANVTTVDLGNWAVTESAGVLYFATSGVNKMKLDASGNLTVVGDVTAYGTI